MTVLENERTDAVSPPDQQVQSEEREYARRICILVLGMHRSGTSALTRLLNMAGAKLPSELLGSGEGNETGHWEPVELIKYHDVLLAELGSSWDDWRPLELRRIPHRQRDGIKSSIKRHIEADFGDAPLIVIKEPRICRFAPLFLEVLDEAGFDTRIALPVRNPLEVAASLEKRTAIWSADRSKTYAGLLWLRHILDAEAATRNRARAIVSYDNLLDDWRSTFSTLTGQLDVTWPYQIADFDRRADKFLTPLQRHHFRSVEDVVLDPQMRGWVADAFEKILVLEGNPTSQPATAALDRIRREFDIASPMLNRLHAETSGRYTAKVKALEDAVDKYEAAAGQGATKLSEHEAEIARLSANLGQHEADARQKSALLAEREAEIVRLSADLSRHESDARQKTALLAEHEAEIARLSADLSRHESDAVEKIALLAEREAEIVRLSADLSRHESDAAEKIALLAEREAGMARLSAALSRLEGQAEQHSTLLSQQEAEIVRISADLSDASAEADVATSDLKALSVLTSHTEMELEERNAEIARLTACLDATQDRYRELQREQSALQRSYDQVKRRVGVQSFSLKTLVSTRNELADYVGKLHDSSSWRYTAPIRNIKLALLKQPPLMSVGSIPVPMKVVKSANFHETGCLIVSPPHTLHLAHLFARAMTDVGFQTLVATDLKKQSSYQHLFVLCPNVFEGIRDGFVAIQMEQTTNARWLTNSYINKLGRASAIIDYSLKNIEFLSTIGFPLHRLFYVPVGTGLPPDLSATHEAAKDIDVLFYGDDQCDRRQKMLQILKAKFSVRVENNKFGPELWALIRRSKIVLNIHYYEDALLETVRLSEALSLGAIVVSEASVDPEQDAAYESAVAFVPVGDTDALAAKLSELLGGTKRFGEMMEARVRLVDDRSNEFNRYFMRFLLAKQMAGYVSMAEMTHANNTGILTKCDIETYPKLCLTLAETPERTQRFRAQGRPEFVLFDGLRHDFGWVGCGLSYKTMLASARAQNIEKILICEDDVKFPSNYDTRMRVIDEYLIENEGQWDLFSGFMADISPQTTILRVEERDGVQFIWMDRAVSTVFNIYAKRAIDALADWDPDNREVEINTIDRHMQRRNLRIVMAYPFLVEHDEDSSSTIWGFENTQYRGMMKQSDETLTKLLHNFDMRNQDTVQ